MTVRIISLEKTSYETRLVNSRAGLMWGLVRLDYGAPVVVASHEDEKTFWADGVNAEIEVA